MADAEDAIRRLDGTEIHGVPVKLEIQASHSFMVALTLSGRRSSRILGQASPPRLRSSLRRA